MTPPPGVLVFLPNSAILGRGVIQAHGVGLHALAGLSDGAGLVLMDPAEVPDQLEPVGAAPTRRARPPASF